MQLITATVKSRNYFLKESFCIVVVLYILSGGLTAQTRQRISINDGWRFIHYESNPDNFVYHKRPEVTDRNDNVVYEPGQLKVIAYKNGSRWAEQSVKTTEVSSQLLISADRKMLTANGEDLSFITVTIADKNGLTVPDANNNINFSVEGPGELVATDNGDPANLVSFASKNRDGYFGYVLAIIRTQKQKPGTIKITASSPGLKKATIEIKTK